MSSEHFSQQALLAQFLAIQNLPPEDVTFCHAAKRTW